MMPAEKIGAVKECFIPSGHNPWCIDDRLPLDEKEVKGPQLLGASLAPMPVLVETALESGEKPEIENIIDVIFQAHQELNMTPTVHKDDHHGEWGGCGFAALLTDSDNPLGLSEKASQWLQEHPDLVERFVRRGSKLLVLTGSHADKNSRQALAVRNEKRKTTLDVVAAHRNKIPAYNHDDWFYGDLIQRCAEVLEGQGKAAWAQRLRERAETLNNGYLNKTTGILAGMEAIRV